MQCLSQQPVAKLQQLTQQQEVEHQQHNQQQVEHLQLQQAQCMLK
jgi:hypothetical protein